MFDCMMDPSGDVSSEQSSECLSGIVNCVYLMAHTGWGPLSSASKQNFCLYREMYLSGMGSFRHPTRWLNLLSVAACSRIYFVVAAASMDIQFDESDSVHSLWALLVCITESHSCMILKHWSMKL